MATDWDALILSIETAITAHVSNGAAMIVSVGNADKTVTYRSLEEAFAALAAARRAKAMASPGTRQDRTTYGRFGGF